MFPRPLSLVVTAVLSVGVFGREVGAQNAETKSVLGKLGVTRGICVLLGDSGGRLAVDLARNSELTVFVQQQGDAAVAAACRVADEAGLYGTRVFVANGDASRIGLADDVADAVVALGAAGGPPEREALRVVRPAGKVLLGRRELTKPFPAGVDDWTHHYHGPDNNPQSKDRLARAPYLTQFIAEPRYGPAPQNAVAANGRLFVAFGHVAWHQREEPWLNTLVALNAFNGTLLWKRPLTPGIMVDRSTMLATPDTLYLADDKSCKLLDAATGKPKDELVAPVDLTGGTFWKWMALEEGVLYALVGEAEKPDRTATWRRTQHGWPWNEISDGYNAGQYEWGQAKTLLALDPKTKNVLWHHQESEPIDSRSLCLKGGRVYFAAFGRYLTCLDAKTGRERWRRTREKDSSLFEAIGPYRPGHGYIGGWKSTVYLKCTDKALYVVGPQTEWLTALSADDGTFLWKYPAKDLHIVIRDDGVYTIGPQNSKGDLTRKLDLLTGEVLASYDLFRRACTRSVGTPDGILFRASEGSVRLDLATGKPQWISPMRPSCHLGVLVANGHLYWVPWTCDCDLQLFGAICLAPAGDFAFDQQATREARLESAGDGAPAVANLPTAPADWPTYRANCLRTARTQALLPGQAKLLWQTESGNAAVPTAPVAAGGLTFYGGSDGRVHAADAATGKERWRAYTGGAITFPPTIADGRAFVGSGDGWAYAFEAATGRQLWRFRAAPAERRIPVYGALLSTWPVASGVLVAGGVAYFAAGITDYDGTHLYALDAATGALKWQNNTAGQLDAFSHRGVACQGELLLRDGTLYLAGGNAVSPGVFDAATGTCRNAPPNSLGTQAVRGRELLFTEAPGRKGESGPRVKVVGQPLYSDPDNLVYSGEVAWDNPRVVVANATVSFVETKGESGSDWKLAARSVPGDAPLWEQPLPGRPVRWGLCVDAQGRVVVTLREGRVLCFGG